MPRPKSYKSYNAIYPAVLYKVQEHYLAGQKPQPITFPNAAAAINFRATLYAYRYALQRELVKEPGNQEVINLLQIGDNISIKVKGNVVTIVDNRMIEVPEEAEGLANFLNTDLETTADSTNVVFEEDGDDETSAEDLFKD